MGSGTRRTCPRCWSRWKPIRPTSWSAPGSWAGTENTDAFRNLGVRFFAKTISVLTGTKLADTSNGLRMMRAELTGMVRQTQPQYETSELMIGAVFNGYRITEVPTVMRKRLSGESKKGRNLAYGFRYARVILNTWLRERKTKANRPAA